MFSTAFLQKEVNMKLAQLLSLVTLCATACAQDLSVAAVKRAFDNANIPTDLKINFNPKFLLEVVLPQPSGLPVLVHTGIQLPRNDTAGPPVFNLINPSNPLGQNAGPGPFVIAAVDPDAPSPTNTSNAQVRHFLGGDFLPARLPIPGAGSVESPLLSNTSAAISDWRQPTPTMGNHRYVFLVFNQPNGFDANSQAFVNATTPIQRWDVATFIQQVGLGEPIAGTFMMVANPDSP
ncbi:hypothetical protein NP233_g6596 [Leucocoprinus birnbaumii]|uniref:PEBP-like protein n=1 Tax=Leucocoprinus birnbaumii TaxID=56174 RepID=A0AAD5VQS7_9AGAR|nr:hypothetical protein NP233_g6596 [Leucocoprinus birnbaumii]